MTNHESTLRAMEIQKRVDEAIYQTFAKAYQQAHAYYDEDKLDECAQECTEIISEPSVPRCIKISTLILLALVVDSEDDSRAARTEAGT